jgi:hypothetical protein
VIGAAEEAARAKVPVHEAEATRHASAMARARDELGVDAFERFRGEGARLSQAELLARLRAAVDAVT